MSSPLAAAVLTVFTYMCLVFLLALVLRDNGIVDVAWGLGFIVVAAGQVLHAESLHPRLVLVSALTFLWGVRLAVHILVRNSRRRGEDFRYRAWREKWGRWFVLRSFLQVFMLQGAVMVVVSAPIITVGTAAGGPLGLLDLAGCAIWLTGFMFEAIGDAQLMRFKAQRGSQDRVMTRGLWRYSRHPNYFGEALLWWGVALIALSSPLGYWALISPVTIDFLLLRVSGIPMLERRYEGIPEFEAYKARTSALVPWFPKREVGTEEAEPPA
jgi:steroid 5-alpha reductase family enzyme